MTPFTRISGQKARNDEPAQELAKDVQSGVCKPEDITEDMFARKLYTDGQPDVDLMIRTSGEQRLSNFLLYQCSYAEQLPAVSVFLR